MLILGGNHKKVVTSQRLLCCNMNKQMIDYLRLRVEQCIGRKMESPKDFKQLNALLPQNEHLSISTLKRLWKYVPSEHVPREETLSILARLCGYNNWADFCINNTKAFDSDFLNGVVETKEITVGGEVVLEWLPDRRCRIRKLSDNRWIVTEAKNCKLQVNDTFSAAWFAVGEPLYALGVERNGQLLSNYIAGKQNGLTVVSVITS